MTTMRIPLWIIGGSVVLCAFAVTLVLRPTEPPAPSSDVSAGPAPTRAPSPAAAAPASDATPPTPATPPVETAPFAAKEPQFRVRVVGPDGKGVPSIRVRVEVPGDTQSRRRARAGLSARSGIDGIATFDVKHRSLLESETWVVNAQLGRENIQGEPFPRPDLGSDSIHVLHVPASTTLVVTLVDGAGQVDRANRELAFVRYRALTDTRHDITGVLRLGGFQPGERLEMWVIGESPRRVEPVRIRDAAEHHVRLTVAPVSAEVSLRLLEADGRPVALRRMTSEFHGPAKDPHRTVASTKRNGRFVANVASEVDGVLEIYAHGTWVGFAKEDPIPIFRRPLEALAAGAHVDLGDVVVQRGPLIVSGRVFDPEGKGAWRVRVQVRRIAPGGGVESKRVRTDADGWFRLHRERPAPEGEYTARVVHGRTRTRWKPFSPGARDLELRLHRCGRLAGRIEVGGDGVFGPPITTQLVDADEKVVEDTVKKRAWRPHELRFSDLIPSGYTLRVEAAGVKLAEVPGLRVVAGEWTRPAGLQPLRVGDAFPVSEVRVTANGQPLARATVWGRTPGTRKPAWRGRTDASGRCRFAHPPGVLPTLKVMAPSYRGQDVTPKTSPVSVDLQPNPPVVVKLSAPLPVLSGVAGYRLRLQRDGEEYTVAVPPGRDRVRFVGPGPTGYRAHLLVDFADQTTKRDDLGWIRRPHGADVAIPIDPEKIRRHVSRWREKRAKGR